jgi:hypothetical protein
MRLSFNSSSRIRQAQTRIERAPGASVESGIACSRMEMLTTLRRQSLVKRLALGPRAQRPSAKKGVVHISLRNFEFRLGA